MKKMHRKFLSAVLVLALIPVGSLPNRTFAAAAAVVKPDPSQASPFNNGEFQGFGTSLCWWANRLGYDEALTQQAADLFFSEEGLGLDIARYNIGGGDDPTHDHITRSDSKVPGYAVGFDEDGSIIYDWTQDQNQRNIASAALKANPNLYIEGFSNSPPYFMTESGCSSGAVTASDNNLKEEHYADFAAYIADTTKYLKENFGIAFQSYSPMNEPDTAYWGAGSPKQEGCHFDPGTSQSNMIIETRKALDQAGLADVEVAGMDETSIDTTITNLDKLTAEAKAALRRIDTHSYGGSKREALKAKAVSMNKDLWMSEVDNGGTAGTNAGNMSAGLNLANFIIRDMNGMQPAAWVLWDIVDFHRDSAVSGEANNTLNQNGGLWGVGMGNHDTKKIELSKKYYVFGQFTKYIEPGDTIIASASNTLAAYDKKTGTIKIVAVNTEASNAVYTFDLSNFTHTGPKAKIIRTSGDFSNGENWADLGDADVIDKKFQYELKANSVTTFIIENNKSNVGYISIEGDRMVTLANAVQYTASASDGQPVVWSSSDDTIAQISSDGLLTPKAPGTVTITAESPTLEGSNSLEVVIKNIEKIKIPSSNVTGSPAWNNTSNDCKKVVDGNLTTFFDGVAQGYVTLDLGADKMIGAISYAPRAGYEYRMVDGMFYGSLDGETWNKIYTVRSKPGSGSLTYIYSEEFEKEAVNTAYRYIKYTVPSGTQSYNGKNEDYNCNIAEIEVWAFNDSSPMETALKTIEKKGNIYADISMPDSVAGVTIEWTSSNETVISANGKVTRDNADHAVTLTAKLSYNGESITKEYPVIVKKSMQGYLFVHFVGTEGSANDEQIYFSISENGTDWRTLNANQPVLTSTVGEMGVRDPHIIRSPEGDKYFLIATDLSIYNRKGDADRWSTCQRAGSRSIVVWELTDLVNWSDARLVKVAPDDAGCTWAPESIYDEEKEAYMVFWASKTASDDYKTQRIYRSYTKDFISFSEPEIYMDGGTVSNIDTSFIKEDNVYYRFTKNETNSSVIMEKSDSLNGEFEAVDTYTLATMTGYEGPTIYKLNDEDRWCLLLDYYSKSQGYKPFMTDDISKGAFTSVSDFNFDTKYRHGTVIPIDQKEYDALIEAYTVKEEPETGEMIFSADFDNGLDTSVGKAAANGVITYEDGYAGKAAVLNSGAYISLTNEDGNSLLTGLDSLTVSFWSKATKPADAAWWFYAAPDNTSQTYKSERYLGILDKNSAITAERYHSTNQERPASASGTFTQGEWKHIAVVYGKQTTTLYINGKQVSTVNSTVDISELLGNDSVVYIGKANWGSGEFANGLIDEFRVFNYALDADGINRIYHQVCFDELTISQEGVLAYKITGMKNQDDQLFAAVYDENDVLIEISTEQEDNICLTRNGIYKIKAFLWDANQTPICDYAVKTIVW